ncbi:MAG: DNA-binding protein [Acidobacteria bacterium]|nr:DNA-binding protein [Acidobacteriota bacterium]MYJ02982.1 DNA-binding protein [Acidobacteriota bacterium]
MPLHHFTLIVDGPDLQDAAYIDMLFEAGCNDGTVGRADGIQYIDFDREAPSFDEAILSAVTDVERVAGAEVVRVADAGLVSMTDIATRIGRTRESVRLLVTGARGPGGFPPPVTDPRGRYRLWRWSDVANWLTTQLGEVTLPEDHAATTLNASLELRRQRRKLTPTFRKTLRALADLS